MLSIKNLVKVYKTKGGAEVRALDDVSVDFPEKGMVFLLGKSGSGKSTLLNVAGGLDKPDRGEVIVKGKSSKSFSSSDFDSYRNTYVGFVFQEYNILDEFNIEQNIALALQLQGKKNDKEAVNDLLKQVDLTGLGKRKPNTLSGGQKQRVAIARALIKEPEIIMADEPTGALDSNTGKQVFDTLKKLSEDKLVIVVSHDREFAEQYADRIIELKDGKILSDTSKALAAPKALSANVNAIGSDTLRVKDWNKLTQDDFNQILAMMKGQKGEVIISSSEADMPAIKRVCKISDDGSKEYFEDTDRSAVKVGQYDARKTRFIKSKMPAARAIKMGASGLKTKPVRLFFTILLSVLSFAMFGVLSTMMMYDPVYSVAEAMQRTTYQNVKLEKRYSYHSKSWRMDSEGNKKYESEYDGTNQAAFGVGEIAELNKNSVELKFAGICSVNAMINNVANSGSVPYYNSFPGSFTGFTDCGEEYMQANNFGKLAGSYPKADNEVAISEYYYEVFKDCGFNDNGKTVTISKADDLIGKNLNARMNGNDSIKLKITGVYSLTSLSHFEELKKKDTSAIDPDELTKKKNSMRDEIENGYHSLGFVTPEFCEKYKNYFDRFETQNNINTSNIMGVRFSKDKIEEDVEQYSGDSYYAETTVNGNIGAFEFYTADGKPATVDSVSLGKDEVYASVTYLGNFAINLANATKGEIANLYWNDRGEEVQITDGAYIQTNGFYANYNSQISLTDKPGYAYITDGRGYVNKNGEFNDGYNGKPEGDWKYIDGYWLDFDGNIVTSDMSNYSYCRSVMYANENGDYSSEKKEGYEREYGGFYRTSDGNVSLERPQDKYEVDYIEGFYVNPANGELSLTPVSGSKLTDHYYKNKTNNSVDKSNIIFATQYHSSWQDADGNAIFCPYNGMLYRDNIRKSYVDYDENADFEAAYLRLMKKTGQLIGWDFAGVGDLSAEDIELIVTRINRDWSEWLKSDESIPGVINAKNSKGVTISLSVKGYFDTAFQNYCNLILSKAFVDEFQVFPPDYYQNQYEWGNDVTTDYAAPADAKYSHIITVSRNTMEQTHFMLNDRQNGSVKYVMNNQVYNDVNSMASMIDMLKLVFLIVGAVMAVLSALLLFNFISASISAKRKEIGILRAVGARGSDVFKIFFSEAAIIALICFVISAIAAGIVCFILNGVFISSAVAISVLNYGILNIAMILGISVVIAFIATILPVYFAAKKPPVESIRAL